MSKYAASASLGGETGPRTDSKASDACDRQSLLVERRWCRSRRSLCALMRFISSSRAFISSVRRSFLDFGASALRSFSSAFSTESLDVSAMANLISNRNAFASLTTTYGRRLPAELTGRPETISSDRELPFNASDTAQATVDLNQQECATAICLTSDARWDRLTVGEPQGYRTAQSEERPIP
jgi:hypothetical protein